jgi:diguanylate cyclase (GGDEF)-like protein
MGKPIRVLIVGDSENDAAMLLHELRRGGYEPTPERVETSEAMTVALDQQTWDVVLADFSMPGFNGIEALALVQRRRLDLPFIFVSGIAGEETAVEAMKAGAHDYILKGNIQRLLPAVERELRQAEVRREIRQAEETVRYLAYYDVLTDLPNRALFEDRIQQAILTAQREGGSVALLMVDLDRFKEINDTLGHRSGDLVLQQVGRRLRDVLRESDTVARLGGDEFSVLLPGDGMDGAVLTARKMLEALDRPFTLDNRALNVKGSIGIGLFPEHGRDGLTLMHRADVAMYMSKLAGEGYVIYRPEHDRYTPKHLVFLGELRQAIERNELLLHYQPKRNLQNGHLIGLEALARWQHPVHGLVRPDGFIGMAEQTVVSRPFIFWVLRTVLQQCRTWHEAGIEVPVSVNLSRQNLQDPKFTEQLIGLLRTIGVKPARLELEIPESIIMSDPAHTLETLRALHSAGIQISIDKFGVGHSSLSYLKKLPVRAIKIDRSLVKDLITDKHDEEVVRSGIRSAQNLGLKTVAVGVESREISERLIAMNCEEAQGYYLGYPMPPQQLTQWVRR